MQTQLPSTQQVEEMISFCLNDKGPRGRRDGALLALMWCAHLSVPQAVRFSADAALRAGSEWSGIFRLAIEEWHHIRPEVVGPLLLSIDRREQVSTVPMKATTAAETIRRRAAEAKVGYVTPQDFLRASLMAERPASRQNSTHGFRVSAPAVRPGQR